MIIDSKKIKVLLIYDSYENKKLALKLNLYNIIKKENIIMDLYYKENKYDLYVIISNSISFVKAVVRHINKMNNLKNKIRKKEMFNNKKNKRYVILTNNYNSEYIINLIKITENVFYSKNSLEDILYKIKKSYKKVLLLN